MEQGSSNNIYIYIYREREREREDYIDVKTLYLFKLLRGKEGRKKVAQDAVFKAYNELYSSWWQRIVERVYLNLQRPVERKTRDLNCSKCI